MKTLLLAASLVAALAASATLASATPASTETNDSRISQALAVTGQVAVANVGDYVQAGSYRIWVSSHLGRPDHVLSDGTWIYDSRHVENSAVGGSVAISFENGRVSTIKLLSPSLVTALLHPAKPAVQVVASR